MPGAPTRAGGPDADVPLLRGVFHVHTNASHDCVLRPEALINRCIDEGIDVLAVTDHNEITGAQTVQAGAPFQVIVGEEIRTAEGGEIIGLFLKQKIAPGLPARAVIAEIRAQQGLVYFPHPFDTVRSKRWTSALQDDLLRAADIIEVFNARNFFERANQRAAEAAQRLTVAPCAGADAHLASEIGPTVVFLRPFTSPPELLTSLRAAEFSTTRSPLWAKATSALIRLTR